MMNSVVRQQVGNQEFVMDPQYLNTDEIRYELRVRGQAANGNRRAIAQNLRQLVAQEVDTPGAHRFLAVGTSSSEYEYVTKNIPRLREVLSQVTSEKETQSRFITLFCI